MEFSLPRIFVRLSHVIIQTRKKKPYGTKQIEIHSEKYFKVIYTSMSDKIAPLFDRTHLPNS
jgi:hypothetical protein